MEQLIWRAFLNVHILYTSPTFCWCRGQLNYSTLMFGPLICFLLICRHVAATSTPHTPEPVNIGAAHCTPHTAEPASNHAAICYLRINHNAQIFLTRPSVWSCERTGYIYTYDCSILLHEYRPPLSLIVYRKRGVASRVSRISAGILKLLRSPGIDSLASIPVLEFTIYGG